MYASKVNAASGVLVYPIASDPASLDPQEADDEVSTLVAAQLYEGLFDLDVNGAIVPAAAQEAHWRRPTARPTPSPCGRA